jgi:hypothetical protein
MTNKTEKKDDKSGGADNEDAESLEEQPLDIGEHYLVRRKSDDWREYIFTVNVNFKTRNIV